jgi:cell division protein FtsW (lipid II flippase)
MEKWRIFTLLTGLGLLVIAALSSYWSIELSSTIKSGNATWVQEVGIFLLFLLAAFSWIFALVLLFYPFFVDMEMGGRKSWRNYFIFFTVLLCFPLIYLVNFPSEFLNGIYSWISLAVFGYGAGHSLFMYIKKR